MNHFRYRRPVRALLKVFTRLNVGVYRASHGRLLNRLPGGAPICLMTMAGRRSGRKHTVALIHVIDGENAIVVAAHGGIAGNPSWYYNVHANSVVGITSAGITRRMNAQEAQGAERAAAWRLAVHTFPAFARLQERSARTIPVFVCRPIG